MISLWSPVRGGCRQGDRISPYVFLLCCIIRKNLDIKGYSINDIEIKVSQFADDASLFWDSSGEALQKCILFLFKFSAFSGFKINIHKTKIKCMWFGCVRPPENIALHFLTLSGTLRVEFTTNLKEITKNKLKKKKIKSKVCISTQKWIRILHTQRISKTNRLSYLLHCNNRL